MVIKVKEGHIKYLFLYDGVALNEINSRISAKINLHSRILILHAQKLLLYHSSTIHLK